MNKCSNKFEKFVIGVAYSFHNNKLPCNVLVGAEYNNIGCCRKAITIEKDELIKIIHPTLLKKLNLLGGVGCKRNGLSLGYCAEVHAASGLLFQKGAGSSIPIDKIKFSNAYRPRNMMPKSQDGIIPYCQNCKDTFC